VELLLLCDSIAALLQEAGIRESRYSFVEESVRQIARYLPIAPHQAFSQDCGEDEGDINNSESPARARARVRGFPFSLSE